MSLPEGDFRIKWIEGYEGKYAITDDGRVWSEPKGRCNKHGKWLKLCKGDSGYFSVVLCADGKLTRRVHRLVLAAFFPTRMHGDHARHLNGNQLDNRYENLAWGTPTDNAQDAVAHGTNYRGGGRMKLTKSDVMGIRRSNETIASLARRHGLARASIRRAKNGASWRNLPLSGIPGDPPIDQYHRRQRGKGRPIEHADPMFPCIP